MSYLDIGFGFFYASLLVFVGIYVVSSICEIREIEQESKRWQQARESRSSEDRTSTVIISNGPPPLPSCSSSSQASASIAA